MPGWEKFTLDEVVYPEAEKRSDDATDIELVDTDSKDKKEEKEEDAKVIKTDEVEKTVAGSSKRK